MVLSATLNKLLNQKPPNKLLLTEISIRINTHLPEDKRIDLENIPDPLIVLSKIVNLPLEAQTQVTLYLETILTAGEVEDKKKQTTAKMKLILISLGIGIAVLAMVVDPNLLTEDFINSLMKLFTDTAESSTP